MCSSSYKKAFLNFDQKTAEQIYLYAYTISSLIMLFL